ncbi:MAG: MFS transporter [Chloroflexi bacterium]|nr:MFS transporter [Chloroflexota bacterium]
MSFPRKLAYSSGNLAALLSYQAFVTYIQFFYIDTLKLPAMLVATIGWTVYGIWNAINDPLAGQLSDRTRTRWGRRIPYILFCTLPLAITFALLWLPPFRVENGQAGPLFAWFLIFVLLFDGLWTVVVLNWTALFPEMFPSLKERTQVSGLRQVFSVIGLLLGVALPPMLYSSIGWGAMGILFAVIVALFFFISLLGSREKKEFSRESLPLGAALRATLKNRSFLTFVGANIFIQFAFLILPATVPFYAKYVLNADAGGTSALLAALFVVAMLLLFPWMKVVVRLGARKALMAACLLFAAPWLAFQVIGDFTGALIGMVAAAVGLAGLLLLLDILVSDIIDEDELATGARREGMYFGINGLLIRLGFVLQGWVMGTVLTVTGYVPGVAQSPSAIAGLKLLMSYVPVVGLIGAFICLIFYPLHGARLAQVKEQVAKLHEEKAKKAEQPSQ